MRIQDVERRAQQAKQYEADHPAMPAQPNKDVYITPAMRRAMG